LESILSEYAAALVISNVTSGAMVMKNNE